MPAHVRKGDTVVVRSGSHKGQVGEVIRVDPDSKTVVIKGVNLVTRHMRPTRTNPNGGVVTREAPLDWSKVNPVVDGKPTRVRFQTKDDGSRSASPLGAARFSAPSADPGRRRRSLEVHSRISMNASKPVARSERQRWQGDSQAEERSNGQGHEASRQIRNREEEGPLRRGSGNRFRSRGQAAPPDHVRVQGP
ncbi:MAG: 50S ribosomal protein L24 [Phycisphaeraceae bacterium]|nr:50S ribosomal protein L24 [Phycisphaeraceae bacterium]